MTQDRNAQPETDPHAAYADRIVGHMNDDHADSVLDLVRAFGDAPDAEAATMTGVDRDGFDVEITSPGPRTVRISFSGPQDTRQAVREELVRMAQEARARLGSQG